MKKLMKLSMVLAVAALAFSSCNCFKKMAKEREDVKLNVTPEILTLNNGTPSPSSTSMQRPSSR